MAAPKRGLRLLIALACLAPGCASTARYPFRPKPPAPATPSPPQQKGVSTGDDYIDTLQRDLSMYSD